MPQLHQRYDNESLPEPGFPVIPIGDYYGIINKSEVKLTKNQDGQYIQLDVIVVENPQFNGHTIVDRINHVNPNEQAVTIANKTIRSINEACNLPGINATEEWHGVPMLISVGLEEASGKFPAKNKIQSYKPLDNPTGPGIQGFANMPVAPVAVAPTAAPLAAPVPVAPVAPAPVAPVPVTPVAAGLPVPPVAAPAVVVPAVPLGVPVPGAVPVTYATAQPAIPAAVTPVVPAAPAAPVAPVVPAIVDPNAPPF